MEPMARKKEVADWLQLPQIAASIIKCLKVQNKSLKTLIKCLISCENLRTVLLWARFNALSELIYSTSVSSTSLSAKSSTTLACCSLPAACSHSKIKLCRKPHRIKLELKRKKGKRNRNSHEACCSHSIDLMLLLMIDGRTWLEIRGAVHRTHVAVRGPLFVLSAC